MSRLRVLKEFKYAYGGVHVRVHEVGGVIEASDEAYKTALEEKWAVREEQPSPGKPLPGSKPSPGGQPSNGNVEAQASPESGPEKPSSSRRRGRRSERKTS